MRAPFQEFDPSFFYQRKRGNAFAPPCVLQHAFHVRKMMRKKDIALVSNAIRVYAQIRVGDNPVCRENDLKGNVDPTDAAKTNEKNEEAPRSERKQTGSCIVCLPKSDASATTLLRRGDDCSAVRTKKRIKPSILNIEFHRLLTKITSFSAVSTQNFASKCSL